MLLSTTSGKHTMMPPGIRFSPRSTNITLQSSLPLVHSLTRRCFPSVFALDSCLLTGFRTHFPNYSQSQECTATHQHMVLQDMLQAANVPKRSTPTSGQSLVRLLVPVKHSPPKSMPAKLRRPSLITRLGMTVPTSLAARPAAAPYVASLENGIYVIKCPNAGNPGIQENAKKMIERIRKKQKKKQQDTQKRKNHH